jgi:hypothetical protein
MCRTRVALLFALALSLAPPVGAQTADVQFRDDIQLLMEVTGAASFGLQLGTIVSDSFVNNMKQAYPDMPDRAIAVIREVFNTEMSKMLTGPRGVQREMIDLYTKHFTPQDVKELLTFYTSPVGQKAVKALPLLTQEGADIGRKWSEVNMPRVLAILQQRLQAEGLLPK